MGAKTWMLVYSAGSAREALSRRLPLDRDAAARLAATLFPGEKLEPQDDGDLSYTCPDGHDICVGSFDGVSVAAGSSEATIRRSCRRISLPPVSAPGSPSTRPRRSGARRPLWLSPGGAGRPIAHRARNHPVGALQARPLTKEVLVEGTKGRDSLGPNMRDQ